MRHRGRRKTWRTAATIALLALLCVGGVELAVCRVADPALFDRITAPVRQGAARLAEGARGVAQGLGEALSRLGEKEAQPPDAPAEPEAETLVNQYATDPAIWRDLSQLDPAVTRLEERGALEILTGGGVEMIYFNQADEAWKEQPYGSDHIGGYGCGPTAMAMAAYTLSGRETDPAQMAQWARRQGHWARGSGSRLSIVPDAAEEFGLICVSWAQAGPEDLLRELAAGKVAVALMGKGHFTQRGHFILLRGATLDGGILVADPVSRERSLAVWDAQLLLDELSGNGAHGGPLWLLSLPEEGMTYTEFQGEPPP